MLKDVEVRTRRYETELADMMKLINSKKDQDIHTINLSASDDHHSHSLRELWGVAIAVLCCSATIQISALSLVQPLVDDSFCSVPHIPQSKTRWQ